MILQIISYFSKNWLGVLTLLVAFLTLLVSIILLRRNRNEELSRLRSLFQHLDEIKRIAKDQYDYLKNQGIPSWTITNVDLNFYLTHINHIVNKEHGLCKSICTRELKKQIINTHDKINNINNLYQLMYHAHVTNTKESNSRVKEYKSQLLNVSYYIDLDNFIEKAKDELKKILSKGYFCNKTWY